MGRGRCQSMLILVFSATLVALSSGSGNETETETTNRRGKALNISKKPCSDPSGRQGVCTFKWDCISQNGTKIGTCMDGFIIGTCCHHDTYPHLYTDAVPDIVLSSQHISLNKPAKQSQGGFVVRNKTQDLPIASAAATTTTSTASTVDLTTLITKPEQSSTQQLVTWTSVSPTKRPSSSKPVQLSIFPFPQGILYPNLQGTGSVAYPAKPYRPNTSMQQFRPPFYGPYYMINNHKVPSKSDSVNASNFTILNGADNGSTTTAVQSVETTTVSVPVPQWTSTKTAGNPQVVNPINRLPVPTVVRPALNYQTTSSLPSTTAKPTSLNATINPASLSSTITNKPQKKPLLDYRKDCGVRALSPRARIVGGTSTHFGKWPWQILVKEAAWLGLYHKNKCGGVLISSKYAITAGHCQPGFLSSLIVLLGEYDLAADMEVLKPEMRRVKRMVVHRHYNPQNFDNDIAILELDPPVVFKPHISPICLPERDEEFTGKMAYVTGWGKTRHGGAIPNLLQEVQVPIVSNAKCLDMFKAAGHVKVIKDNFLCAGYETGGKDSCEGDSGGPLMVKRDDGRWVLAGTVSHGIRCADPNLPGVYMRISSYRPWIDKIIGA